MGCPAWKTPGRRAFGGFRDAPDRGAALVEFALVLPLLLALLLGIITGGLAFNRSNSVENAAREAARFGATLPVDGNLDTWLVRVSDVAMRSASGDLDTGVEGRTICVAYVFPNGTDPEDVTTRVVTDQFGTRVKSNQPCFADGRPADEHRVQVQLERRSLLQVLFFQRNVNLQAESTNRFERADQ